MSKIESINLDRLRWSFKDRGVSMPELAKVAGLNPAKLQKVLDGDAYLGLGHLERIADYLGRGLLFFLDASPVEPERVHSPQFRTLSNQKTGLTPRLLSLIERVERHRKVFMGLREELGSPIPEFVPPSRKAGEAYATTIRTWLELRPRNDFTSFREAVEAKGVFVLRTNGYAGKWQIDSESPICGLSIHRKKLPVIVVRKESSETRQSFTLFHELGHLLLHRKSVVDDVGDLEAGNGIERDANAFAGAVLVPSQFLSEIDDTERPKDPSEYRSWLGGYSRRWGASVEVVLRRLLDAKRLSKVLYEGYRSWAETQAPVEKGGGNRKNRHREPAHVFGKEYVRTVFDAMHTQQITLSKASTYLDNLKVKDVRKLGDYVANV